MRILHVSQPVEAGVPGVVLSLVGDELGQGHDVHVACPAGVGLAERATALGARHHGWEAVRTPGVSVVSETRRLGAVVHRVRPDVLVLHSAKAGLSGRLLRHRAPVVYVPHAWSFEAVTGDLQRLTQTWEVLAGRRTDVVMCVSADEMARGRALGVGARTEVVPNGVDLETRRPGDRAAARAQLALDDVPTVVCVARLAEQKGVDRLLDTWPLIRSEVPDSQLVIVGDGPDGQRLRARDLDGVRFVGSRADVDLFFAAADVVALPSRWESTPLVGLEAMAAARPVVAFEVGGLRTAMGETGVILQQDDAAGYAAAVVDLLRHPDRATSLGTAARRQVEEAGDLRHTLREWDRVLRALGGQHVPASTGSVVDGNSRRPLRQLPVTSLTAQLLGGAFRDQDVAVVSGRRRGDRVRAVVAAATGIPVLWADWTTAPPRGPGVLGLGTATVRPEDEESGLLARVVGRAGAGATATPPPVSVVVTALNEGNQLQRLVDDLLPQLSDDDEIVLVDGGSRDGSVEGLRPHPSLRVEVVPGAGISEGRNIGVEKALHEIIVCTDVGCEPAPGFVDAFRNAFSATHPPALVSGVYLATARNAMERAQALACYPQPEEVRRPSVLVTAYTRLFGTGYDPRFAVGRCVGFSRTAWWRAGGFPEDLATGEDVSFGLAVARDGVCVAATDAVVSWHQRDGVRATWRMYRGYGRASTDGGDLRLLARDATRGAAYLIAPALATTRTGRRLAALGALGYLSLPVVRAVRAGAGPATFALLPFAMAVKDLGKLAGALQGVARRRDRVR